MPLDIGIRIDPSQGGFHPGGPAAVALAELAEQRGLDLVVLAGDSSPFDPWTSAAWIAGRTSRIAIGVEQAHVRGDSDASSARTAHETSIARDAEAPVPSVVAKAADSLDLLAPGRLLVGEPGRTWAIAPEGADPAALRAIAAQGLPVVVPVRTAGDVERLVGLCTEMRTAANEAEPEASAARNLAARSRRAPGIDYDGVPASLAATAVEPGDAGYRAVSNTYLRGGAPGLVLRPTTPEEVADALAFADRHRDVPFGIRSAGHGISGRSTNRGGIVVDVGAMNGIEVLDRERRLVRIGPGATWKEVAAVLHPYGWALGSGDYGGVGVGGLATAGGIGLLSRAHGLTIDRLRAVELVLADGTLVRASDDENAELFWAVRGAGANFGVATAFEFEVYPIDDVGWAKLTFLAPDIEESLAEFGRVASEAPRDTTVFYVTGAPREQGSVVQLFGIVDSPDPDTVVERLTPFTRVGLLAQQEVVVTPYANVMAEAHDVGPDGQHGGGEPVSRSAFLPALTPEFARDAAALLKSGLVYFFELRTMGGAISDVSPDAMAYSHRSPAFSVVAMGADDARMDAAWDRLRRHFDGLYLSFETSRDPARLRDAFPGPVLERLRALKRELDPTNLLRDNFNIDPGASGALDAPTTPDDRKAA
ncbi:LLM class flavin-dependent oxidoreductase [Agromyces protaetiae]|uniref:LLM class flavin-dependent oxidoreductase n=1 Tax=Agromyces protaetiae TaxID=2509455 RepID=A0A4P6FFE3_9MICO|nr:FAD-binding oxidoreductase [Agromyces protaetiae]QAY74665.1 LLM class flavin-dependent oxidoreductase [Agromyces protaetiae]